MLLTPERYLESIRSRGIRVHYRAETIDDVVGHPVLAPAARSLAETYRLALDPETRELLTAKSTLTGDDVNVSNIVWQSNLDLLRRIEWERLVARLTARGALRSPGLDAINALAIVTRRIDREKGTRYRERFDAFLRQVHENDWAVSGAMTDPRGDRSKRPSEQADPDLYLRVVEKRSDGVVLRGAKSHQTSACHSHFHLVLPLQCREGEEDWAIAAAVPSNAPGLYHVYSRQPGDDRRFEPGDIDVGLARFGGCESLMVFDDVFVPNDHILLNGEVEYTQALVGYFGSFHRFCYGGCKVGIGDVVIGAAAALANANGVLDRPLIRDKLSEMVLLNETLYACAVAAAAKGVEVEGVTIPDLALANVTKLNVTRAPFEIARLAADIAGGAMTTLPSEKDLRHEKLGPVVRKFMAGRAGVDPEVRMRLFRLLEFLTHGMGSTYFLHESLHGAGAPEAMKITLRREIDLDPFVAAALALSGSPPDALSV
jgi:4-hydroxybutyryl-CoA dehydratase/vinylacetyl-CoA-Delta-isomerase